MSKHIKSETLSRGGRLARRARSFKEDFLGRINQIRSPSVAASPCKKNKTKTVPEVQDEPKKDINTILHSVHLLSTDLRYFQDVVEKNILEMLPGSATVILETVFNINSILKESLLNEQSSLMLSASNQVYQTLSNLIRWADNVLLYGEKAAEKENVCEIVQAVKDAVKSLVQLSLDRLQQKELQNPCDEQTLSSAKPESPYRNSLPDIPLTPRELEILEQTKTVDFPVLTQLHHSTSSDSILSLRNSSKHIDTKPPPKPPLPSFIERTSIKSNPDCTSCESAPPLPPKKKLNTNNLELTKPDTEQLTGSFGSINTDFNSLCTIDWPFSQSPDNLTPISKSSASSLDSNLNLNYSIDDLSYSKHKYTKCSETHQQQCMSSLTSQTYNAELSSFASSMTTATTSVSLHSNDISGSSHEIVNSVNEFSVSTSRISYQTSSTTETDPPALPIKLRKLRNLSQYDNMPQVFVSDIDKEPDGFNPQCSLICNHPHTWSEGNHMSLCPHHNFGSKDRENGKPPPLPPKEKTIRAYMQMFGSYSQPSESEFLRHSVHTLKVVQTNWQQIELSLMQQASFSSNFISSNEESSLFESFNSSSSISCEKDALSNHNPPSIPPKKNKGTLRHSNHSKHDEYVTPFPGSFSDNQNSDNISPSSYDTSSYGKSLLSPVENESSSDIQGALDELDPSEYLIWKRNGEEGPDLRGGSVDSLIVQATRVSKNDFLYQEAFLTTYRTFISPHDLICKLLYRYNKFIHVSDMRQRAARNSFALLVRVVDDLCLTDIHENVLKLLMDFICQLVCRGDLLLARALRKKVVEKCYLKQRSLLNAPILLPSMAISTHKALLLDFKSENLAEQMTVLDSDLFQKIEIPEVLLWAREQKEDLSPNLTTFTEHFNKMSYWARSRILEQEDAKDRERYVVKFIKVMKCLRKLNNFNSYLAILSALDSAPIRRLEWQRNITEGLKEYCALIDSSSSFRAYRQALAETSPPCIPYIGLILQDLTFVHIGNSDMLTEEAVNFSKRWQQFNILDNMRRFKNSQYPVKRNEQIISFFNNFDDYLCEEAMWQISETIKPRGRKKKSCDPA
ncbi:guanine nucleotide-releasing factor 2 isoform X2 [Parasteatoda tepidariorum]|uniref:guanine nucleotide-releasing factor 2 isoform X2 n=1 Tax=Parasteatoda tepidariorum TaxID=114398 RepID=UPI00077F99F7|nr:rap guanine nucleotide exchange factor 1 isoform X2 [Parasteatoda tepidariorum]